MSMENPSEKPPVAETVRRKSKLLVMSANIIDKKGKTHETSKNKIFKQAEWEDADTGTKYILSSKINKKIISKKMPISYRFSVHPSQSSGEASAYYMYGSDSDYFDACNENWKADQDKMFVDQSAAILQYLSTIQFPLTIEDELDFEAAIENVVLNNPKFEKRVRRIARWVMFGTNDKRVERLVKKVHQEEPLLSKDQIHQEIVRRLDQLEGYTDE